MPFGVSTGLRFHPQVILPPLGCVGRFVHAIVKVALLEFPNDHLYTLKKKKKEKLFMRGIRGSGGIVVCMLCMDGYRGVED